MYICLSFLANIRCMKIFTHTLQHNSSFFCLHVSDSGMQALWRPVLIRANKTKICQILNVDQCPYQNAFLEPCRLKSVVFCWSVCKFVFMMIKMICFLMWFAAHGYCLSACYFVLRTLELDITLTASAGLPKVSAMSACVARIAQDNVTDWTRLYCVSVCIWCCFNMVRPGLDLSLIVRPNCFIVVWLLLIRVIWFFWCFDLNSTPVPALDMTHPAAGNKLWCEMLCGRTCMCVPCVCVYLCLLSRWPLQNVHFTSTPL